MGQNQSSEKGRIPPYFNSDFRYNTDNTITTTKSKIAVSVSAIFKMFFCASKPRTLLLKIFCIQVHTSYFEVVGEWCFRDGCNPVLP